MKQNRLYLFLFILIAAVLILPATARAESDIFDAAKNGNLTKARSLIASGVNLHAMDGNGYTAIIIASREGHTEIVELLIKNGANVNSIARNEYAYNSVMKAAWKGHNDILVILIDAGADVNHVNREGETALQIAYANGNKKGAMILKNAGARK
ncbi:MAG: ankyrin repeat domain-containing protein [Thermodesulfobacteriota bacterium]